MSEQKEILPEKQYFGVDVRFNYSAKKGIEFYQDLLDPAWYPDSMVRSIKHNLYNNMLNKSRFVCSSEKRMTDKEANKIENSKKALDFYYKQDYGFLLNNVKSVVQKVVSNAYSQISSIAGVLDKVGNFLSGNKKEENDELTVGDLYLINQPMLDIQGILTTEKVYDLLSALSNVRDFITNAFTTISNSVSKSANPSIGVDTQDIINYLTATTPEKIKNIIKNMFNVDINEMLSLNSLTEFLTTKVIGTTRIHNLSEKILLSIVSGTYKIHFRAPFIKNDSIFNTANGNGWGLNSLDGGKLGTGQLSEDLNDLTGIMIPDIAMRYQYNISEAYENPNEISTTFVLFNDTLEHFIINFRYVMYIIAMCKPVTDGLTIRPPYLFNVCVPGGLRHLLCACSVNISNLGQVRKIGNDSYAAEILKSIVDPLNPKEGFSLSHTALSYVPDAYKVSLKFKPLLSNTWNFDQAYLTNVEIGVPKELNNEFKPYYREEVKK